MNNITIYQLFFWLLLFFLAPVYGDGNPDTQKNGYDEKADNVLHTAVSGDGTAIEMLGRVLYLKDVKLPDWSRLWSSFFHAGVLSTVFSGIALRAGCSIFARNHEGTASVTPTALIILSGFFYFDALITRGARALTFFTSIYGLAFPAPYIVLAGWLLTRENHDPNNPIGNIFNNQYMLLGAPLAGYFYYQYFDTQTEDSASVNLALSGDIARQLTIKAIRPVHIKPYYQLTAIALSGGQSDDSYSHLAAVMDELKLGKLLLQPVSRLYSPKAKKIKRFVRVFGVYQSNNTRAFLHEQAVPDQPLLLDYIYPDRIQTPNGYTYSLLSPDFIGKVADLIGSGKAAIPQAQFDENNDHFDSLTAFSIVSGTYNPDSAAIQFDFPNARNEAGVRISLGLEDDSISMATECKDETHCIKGQYVSPAWFNKFMLLQLSYLGYVYGQKLTESVINTVLSSYKAIPLFEIKEYTGEDAECLVCMGELRSSTEVASQVADEDALPPAIDSLVELTCKHPICPQCLNTMVQDKISTQQSEKWKFFEFFSFVIPCPMCRNKGNRYLVSP